MCGHCVVKNLPILIASCPEHVGIVAVHRGRRSTGYRHPRDTRLNIFTPPFTHADTVIPL